MKNIDKKKEIVKALSKELKEAASLVFVDYSGLTVKLQQELKKRLKAVGANMLVAKNTLLKLSGKEAQIPQEALKEEVLSGQTALIVSSDDAISPIQILGKFSKEFEAPRFKVGVVEGNFQDNDSLVKISSLPSKDALLGQMLSTIGSPLYGLVGSLEIKMQELIYILNAKQGGDTNGS